MKIIDNDELEELNKLLKENRIMQVKRIINNLKELKNEDNKTTI